MVKFTDYKITKQRGVFYPPQEDWRTAAQVKEDNLWQAEEANRCKRLGIYGQPYVETWSIMDCPELDNSTIDFSKKDTSSIQFIIFDVSNG